jgi:hypothetical protein
MADQTSTSEGPKFFTRHGNKYTAIYDKSGKLISLERNADGHGRPSALIPHDSQTFRRLAANNRGNKFVAT